MNTVESQFEGGLNRFGHLHHAKGLIRPNDFPCRNIPPQAARQDQALALGQERLAASQLPLRLSAFRDVAQVAGEGRWPVQWDACDRKFGGKFAPIGTYRRHFDALPEHPGLTRVQIAGEPLPVPLSKCRRDDDVGQLPAQDLVPTVAERALRSGIEFGDATFVVDRHDAFERRVQDGCLARLAALQFLLGALSVIDVDDYPVPMSDLAISVVERLSSGLNPSILSVRAPDLVDIVV